MVSENAKNIMMIVVVSAICIIVFAYLFGIVFVNVLGEKMRELRFGVPMGRSSLEGFENRPKHTSEEEEWLPPAMDMSHSHSLKHITLEEELSRKIPISTSEEEIKVKVTIPSIRPEAINQRYNEAISQLKRDMEAEKKKEEKAFTSASGILEEDEDKRKSSTDSVDDDKIVISKKFLIENFGGFAQVNPNLKLKTKLDEEYMKLFSKGKDQSSPSPDGYAALEREDQGRSAWNFDYEKNDQVHNLCFRNHKHGKKCNYGPTNYADPRTMNTIEKRTFMLNYPPNMTMQDYTNWLYCFANGGEDQLPYNHLKNLEKLKKGIPLVKEEGVCPPSGKYFPPLDAEKYFQTMYDLKTKEIAFASNLNSTTGPLMGANYNQYSDFAQNMGQFGLSGMVVNPDLAYKKEAKIVDNYIIPKDSSNMENVQGN
jgi:hypothetical protein